jgi:type 1 glutamine amidotransferase
VTAYHSHPKPACAADYDATLTEVYSSRPWVHTAWRCGELAGFSNVFRVPVLFNVYPHEHYTAAEARYKAIQGLAAGAYPNFWSTPGMQPVFDFMRRNAEYLDFATTAPVKFLALPRDVRLDPTQAATPAADGVRYRDDRFLAPAVGAYAALTRSALPVLTLQRPHFHEHLAGFQVLCLANMTNMSDEQVQAVRRYVRSGGGLIASHETSLYDEKGRRRPDFALADVFGARYRRVLGAASRRVRFEPASPLAAGLAGLPPLEHAEPHVAVELTTGRCAARLTGPDLAPDVPAAIVHEFGKGRVVYLPGRLDALECYQLTPQVERLFANAVRWLVRGRLPIEVTSPGMVGVSCFRQPRRLLVHLVNHQRDSRLRDDAFQPLVRVGVRLQLPPGFEVARVHRLWTPSDVAYKCNGDCLLTELDTIGEYEVLAVELKPIIVHAVGNALFVVPPLGGVTADFRLKPVLRTSVVSSRVQ